MPEKQLESDIDVMFTEVCAEVDAALRQYIGQSSSDRILRAAVLSWPAYRTGLFQFACGPIPKHVVTAWLSGYIAACLDNGWHHEQPADGLCEVTERGNRDD